MANKTFDFDQSIGYTRKKFGAKPDVISDKSQIPTVKVDSQPIIPQHQTPVAQTASGNEGQSQTMPVAQTASGNEGQSQIMPVAQTVTSKNESANKSIDKLILNMKIKTSTDCLRMYYLIHTLSDKFNNSWVEITRSDFEENGVRASRLVTAREEGVERELFEYKTIIETNKKTNKEYVKGFEYRLITK